MHFYAQKKSFCFTTNPYFFLSVALPSPHLHSDSYSMESLYCRIILDISLVINSIFIELCIMHYPVLR